MTWKKEKLKIQLDTTTLCNARCPQCHRNNDKTLKDADWLPSVSWSIEDFKKAFPKDVLQNIDHINFCPTFGDPVMNIDLYDMCEYIIRESDECSISINTNGSIRDDDWWFRLSSFGKRLTVTFAVDGINQEMHSTYRRGTNFLKVLKNLEAFSAGISIPKTQTIVFRHNEEYLKKIEKICFSHGSTEHINTPSTRFAGSYESYFDEKEDKLVRLYKTTKGFESKIQEGEGIDCSWSKQNEVTINYNGQVLPCCYIGNNVTILLDGGMINPYYDNEVMSDYLKNKDSYNIFKKSLNEIMDDSFFRNNLSNTWNNQTAPHNCYRHCTKNSGRELLKDQIIFKG